MTSLQEVVLFCFLAVQVAVSLPVFPVKNAAESADYDLLEYAPELDKRDLEQAVFLDVPEALALLLQLPRTDRKFFLDNEYTDPADVIVSESAHGAPARLPPHLLAPMGSAPEQKEITGPIVVGPQTKSVQTSSAKKP